jgi:hypothetical protein
MRQRTIWIKNGGNIKMYEPKLNDNVIIRKSNRAGDNIYIGLKGKVVRVFEQQKLETISALIKVKLSNNDEKYYLGDTPFFPVFCLKK